MRAKSPALKSLSRSFRPFSRRLVKAATVRAMAANAGLELGPAYLTAEQSSALDAKLMSDEYGYTIDNLMELAGVAVAHAVVDMAPNAKETKTLILVGPGNNGGDGLVAARHLALFGYEPPTLCIPKETARPPFVGLRKLCDHFACPRTDVDSAVSAMNEGGYDVVIDALFGFSFSGAPRPPFDKLLAGVASAAKQDKCRVLSVDVPSGWPVDGDGKPSDDAVEPQALISLTAPKACAKGFRGTHYLGGRFVPPAIAEEFSLNLPTYPGVAQICKL
ncbi:NAD(P)H-hydrate epimerase [Pycnococcus provasolii]